MCRQKWKWQTANEVLLYCLTLGGCLHMYLTKSFKHLRSFTELGEAKDVVLNPPVQKAMSSFPFPILLQGANTHQWQAQHIPNTLGMCTYQRIQISHMLFPLGFLAKNAGSPSVTYKSYMKIQVLHCARQQSVCIYSGWAACHLKGHSDRTGTGNGSLYKAQKLDALRGSLHSPFCAAYT